MTSPPSFESEINDLRLSAVWPQLFWVCASLKMLIWSLTPTEDIILMKLMASRDKDLGDINGLIAVHGRKLDWDYCLATARQLDEALATDLVETLERIRMAKSRLGG